MVRISVSDRDPPAVGPRVVDRSDDVTGGDALGDAPGPGVVARDEANREEHQRQDQESANAKQGRILSAERTHSLEDRHQGGALSRPQNAPVDPAFTRPRSGFGERR